MKSRQEQIEDVRMLRKAGEDVRAKAQRFARHMTDDEKRIVRECEDHADELEREIPGVSLTMQGPGAPGGRRVEGPFQNFGEQLTALAHAGNPSGYTDPRLYNAASGLNETTPSEGGFLVQSDFSKDLLKSIFEYGQIAGRCRTIPISTNANSVKINGYDETSRTDGNRAGGIQSYWIGEASELTASKPKFRQIQLVLKKLIGLCYATDEVLADAVLLESAIREGFVSEFGFVLDDVILRGSGAGMPLGVLSSGALVTVDGETDQPRGIVSENVLKMWARLLPESYRNSVWLCNPDCLPAIYRMTIAIGDGGTAIFQPAGGLSARPYDTLMGRPLIPCEQCSTVGEVGDLILADFGRGYLLARKGGIQAAMSIHTRFQWDESCFRFVMRVDGCPVLAAPVTPANGTDTLSHFVALALRNHGE